MGVIPEIIIDGDDDGGPENTCFRSSTCDETNNNCFLLTIVNAVQTNPFSNNFKDQLTYFKRIHA